MYFAVANVEFNNHYFGPFGRWCRGETTITLHIDDADVVAHLVDTSIRHHRSTGNFGKNDFSIADFFGALDEYEFDCEAGISILTFIKYD